MNRNYAEDLRRASRRAPARANPRFGFIGGSEAVPCQGGKEVQELFLSTSTHRLDAKGRVSVPAGFRSAVADSCFPGIILYPHHEESAPFYNGCSHERMERYSSSIDADGPFSDRSMNLGYALMSVALQLTFDSGGRVVLPEKVIAHCGLTEEVCFVGLGATFQLWEPGRFTDRQAKAREALPGLISEGGLFWTDRPERSS